MFKTQTVTTDGKQKKSNVKRVANVI